MEYHRTQDLLYVMKLLSPKSINTLIYTQLGGIKTTNMPARLPETSKRLPAS
jgi:hypothetical protein